MSSLATEKKRIEWIDTAKGICIFLVVLHHTSRYLKIGYPCATDFMVFRMPLYFILSGLFFKTYNGVFDFIQHKVNKLVIPYMFFFAFMGVIIPVVLFQVFGFKIWSYNNYGLEAFRYLFSEEIICNPSIWFLICLFEVNILFYIIQFVSRNSKNHKIVCLILSLFFGSVGLCCASISIDLPYFIDSALTATPFFFAGWYMRNYTRILTFNYNKMNRWFTLAFVIFVGLIIHFINRGTCSFISNSYGGNVGQLQLYPYGILGTLVVLLVAKMIGSLPLLSYSGRYSIIVLCTHAYVIQFSGIFWKSITENRVMLFLLTFFTTVLLCVSVIPFFRKFLPYVTAQKDFLRFTF